VVSTQTDFRCSENSSGYLYISVGWASQRGMGLRCVGWDGLVRVLFVCSGNAHRSPLAEALLRKMRRDWVVDSAGVDVAIPIADGVREFLRRENAEEYLKSSPESLSGKRLVDYDVIVAMEKEHRDYVLSLCPDCGDKVVVWNVSDPYFMDKENAWKVYEKIKEKVTGLATRLKPL
jgi:protein-tyrosine-phosphatase